MENKECSRALHAWKAHLLLSVNQEEAKQNALTQLDEETCLIIMDWAMKYLPQHYREQMSEFFGKRGRSWHISAVITRSQEEGRCEVECFVHLFNTCKQNSFAVMSVIEHLLHHQDRVPFFAIRQLWLLSRWAHDPQPSVHPYKIWCNNTTLRLFRPPSRKRYLRQENCPHESSLQEMGV